MTSCVFATTTRDHPVHLWDSTTGEVLYLYCKSSLPLSPLLHKRICCGIEMSLFSWFCMSWWMSISCYCLLLLLSNKLWMKSFYLFFCNLFNVLFMFSSSGFTIFENVELLASSFLCPAPKGFSYLDFVLQLRCTYRAYDAMDEITAAFSIAFNPTGTKYTSWYARKIVVPLLF